MKKRSFLNDLVPSLAHRHSDQFFIPWPLPGNSGEGQWFSTIAEWKDFVASLSLNNRVPDIVSVKFQRAQKVFFLGWNSANFLNAGGLVSLTALDVALQDRYGDKVRDKNGETGSFADLLHYMVKKDGLSDDNVPIIQGGGIHLVNRLAGDSMPSLAEIWNALSRGDPIECPWIGLLEIVRDLIDYAYRDVVSIAAAPREISKLLPVAQAPCFPASSPAWRSARLPVPLGHKGARTLCNSLIA